MGCAEESLVNVKRHTPLAGRTTRRCKFADRRLEFRLSKDDSCAETTRRDLCCPDLADTRALKKARYLRRWVRLTDFAFSSEDAVVLAYGDNGDESWRV
jgi:hypothetical protein